MATPTTNYNLLKPGTGETYDVALLDANYDKIDAALFTNLHLIRHAEFTGTIVSSVANNGVNFGQLTQDNANTFNNTFASAVTGGGVKFLESGLYLVFSTAVGSAGPGVSQLWGSRSGSVNDNPLSVNYQGYGGPTFTGIGVLYAAVNDVIQLGATTTNTVNVTSRVKVSKIMG